MDQPWTFTLVHGGAHPDNNPPLTSVAEASEEAVAAEEAFMNALYAKDHAESAVPKAEGAHAQAASVAENLEDHTVAELKEIAAQKGVELNWDDNKTDIIKKIKKAK